MKIKLIILLIIVFQLSCKIENSTLEKNGILVEQITNPKNRND